MKDDVFIRILDDDPPAPPPGASAMGYGYEPRTRWGYASGTRWGYKFWQGVEDRARQRQARNATLRVLKELSTRVPHSPHFRRIMDPTVPVELQAWPIDLMR